MGFDVLSNPKCTEHYIFYMHPMSALKWYSFIEKFWEEITVGPALTVVTVDRSESLDTSSSGKHPLPPNFLPPSFCDFK